jgi:hypothetical protein
MQAEGSTGTWETVIVSAMEKNHMRYQAGGKTKRERGAHGVRVLHSTDENGELDPPGPGVGKANRQVQSGEAREQRNRRRER